MCWILPDSSPEIRILYTSGMLLYAVWHAKALEKNDFAVLQNVKWTNNYAIHAVQSIDSGQLGEKWCLPKTTNLRLNENIFIPLALKRVNGGYVQMTKLLSYDCCSSLCQPSLALALATVCKMEPCYGYGQVIFKVWS